MKDETINFTEQEKALIRELQEDVASISAPFKSIGDKVGLSEEEVIAKIRDWKEKGIIRRFGAAIKHHKAGITANVMVVWKVPVEKAKEIGSIMASHPAVSHCYERPVFPQWPYNLFTMVHGKSTDECRKIADEISDKTGIKDFKLLFSTKEYKKSSMKYFID